MTTGPRSISEHSKLKAFANILSYISTQDVYKSVGYLTWNLRFTFFKLISIIKINE